MTYKNDKYAYFTIVLIALIILILIYRIYKLSSNESFESNDSKIAFIFLTYNNLKRPDIWSRFLDIKDDNDNINNSKYINKFTIYNHAKEPKKITDIVLKDKHIPEHIDTCWGCFAAVEANIFMLKEALKDPLNKKFILLSESCIPIVSFDTLYLELMKDDKSRFIFWDINNTTYRYIEIIEPEFTINEFIKHNGQGLIFNRKHAELLVNSLEKYKNKWKKVGCVDEHYFGNVLKLLDDSFDSNNNKKKSMFHSWHKDDLNINNICNNENIDCICEIHNHGTKSSSLFKHISNNSIDEIRQKEFLFIRKVDDTTKIDIDYLLS
jgi:hypothetical protein